MRKFRKIINIFSCLLLGVGLMAAPQSSAQKSYDIKELTPAVKAALDGRRGRFDQLRLLKGQGIVGENNRGYVEVILNDKDNKEADSIVNDENKDRKFIYMTILDQNNLPKDSLQTIETVFAQVQRDKANPGDKIQDESGKWVVK